MTAPHVLLIFLDGIGLGTEDPAVNPFAAAHTPTLWALAGGQPWTAAVGRVSTERASLIPTDAQMGVPGRPQSASGQASILTGRPIPQLIGEHYGPRPNPAIRALLREGTFFSEVTAQGRTAALLEAYPPRWHNAVNSGKLLRSSYQEAAFLAGLPIFDETHLYRGDALTTDWTGEGWRTQLGYTDSPLYPPAEAGRRMVALARRYDFSFFPHWLTDTVGHRGTIADGVRLLELFDAVLAEALADWQLADGWIIITSDHGNLEDLSHGKHTENPVPTVIIGPDHERYAAKIDSLADLVPQMRRMLWEKA